jgi:hypothetical protein
MFGSMFGSRPTSAPEPAPQQQAPAPAPQQQSHTAQNVPLPPVTVPAPGSNNPAPVSVADIMARMNGGTEVNAGDFAHDLMNALMATPQAAPPQAVRVNPDLLRNAFADVDLTTGVNLGQIEEALRTGRPVDVGGQQVNGADLLRSALNSQGLNVMTAITPLLNQMIQRAIEQAQTSAVTTSRHEQASQALVTEFTALHPYAASRVTLPLVTEMCNSIVRANNGGPIDKAQVFRALDAVFQGISTAIRPDRGAGMEAQLPARAETSFDDLFGSSSY